MELAETLAPFMAEELEQKVDRVHEEQVCAGDGGAVWAGTRVRRRILALESVLA